jgi:hypothetical protein
MVSRSRAPGSASTWTRLGEDSDRGRLTRSGRSSEPLQRQTASERAPKAENPGPRYATNVVLRDVGSAAWSLPPLPILLRALPKTPGHRARRSCGRGQGAESRAKRDSQPQAARRAERSDGNGAYPYGYVTDERRGQMPQILLAFQVAPLLALCCVRPRLQPHYRDAPSARPCTTPKSAATRCPGVFGSALKRRFAMESADRRWRHPPRPFPANA